MTIVEGAQAPDFRLLDQHGEDVVLSEVVAERPALLFFFPFAFSGICTTELDEVNSRLEEFQHPGLQFFGVSCDPMFSLRAWAEHKTFGFPLLSDFWPHGDVTKEYGVFMESSGMPKRGTFLVGQGRRVLWSTVMEPGERRDLDEVLAAVNNAL